MYSIAPAEAAHNRYLQHISRFPLLSAEEEMALARRWREHQDRAAAHKLVTSHLRLVARIANGHRGYGLPVSDLLSEGSLGMMRAIERFDPDRGVRLATYAVWWIRAAIQDFVLRNHSVVRTGATVVQKRLFFNLRRAKGVLQSAGTDDLDPDQLSGIAKMLDVPEAEVIKMNGRLSGPDYSLNVPVRRDGEGEWQNDLADETANHEVALGEAQELNIRTHLLSRHLHELNDRERHVLDQRWLTEVPATLRELALVHGVSPQRIRQIEVRAIGKLRKAMTAAARPATPARTSVSGSRKTRTDAECRAA